MCHHYRIIEREALYESEDEEEREFDISGVRDDREEKREPLVPTADD